MPMRTKRADQLEVGDVLASNASRGPMSVKQVAVVMNPLLQTTEVRVVGPLGIVEKYHANRVLYILN